MVFQGAERGRGRNLRRAATGALPRTARSADGQRTRSGIRRDEHRSSGRAGLGQTNPTSSMPTAIQTACTCPPDSQAQLLAKIVNNQAFLAGLMTGTNAQGLIAYGTHGKASATFAR